MVHHLFFFHQSDQNNSWRHRSELYWCGEAAALRDRARWLIISWKIFLKFTNSNSEPTWNFNQFTALNSNWIRFLNSAENGKYVWLQLPRNSPPWVSMEAPNAFAVPSLVLEEPQGRRRREGAGKSGGPRHGRSQTPQARRTRDRHHSQRGAPSHAEPSRPPPELAAGRPARNAT